MPSRVLPVAFVAVFAFGIAACSAGVAPGSSGDGSGTSEPSSEGSSGSSSSNGSSGSSGSNGGTGSTQPAPAPSSSSSNGSTPAPTPSTPPPGSSGPRPECVAFANHQCACYGSNASATCTKDLASGCENGVQLCASQLTWYNCVTANACGTKACTAPSGC